MEVVTWPPDRLRFNLFPEDNLGAVAPPGEAYDEGLKKEMDKIQAKNAARQRSTPSESTA